MQSVLKHANKEGLVIFVGAGVSMLPPTSLPSWYELNQMTLTALGERVGNYVHSSRYLESRIRDLVNRRDGTDTFAPDYQAQIMVEECGLDYFRVLQAMDTVVRNHCHDAIAQ